MRKAKLTILIFLIGSLPVIGQYLSNPSFEGTILMIGPPPGWSVCNYLSSPNVQPGKYDVFLPPSDGITYLGMLARDDGSWEDIQAPFEIPLSKDSCYIFRIDLAYWQYLSFTTAQPAILKVYGSDAECVKTNLIWTSPAVDTTDWKTYEFTVHNPEFDIYYLIIDIYYPTPGYYDAYMVLDNIRIDTYPEVEIGNDTVLELCYNDTLFLDPGNGYASYYWQDGSTNQTFPVTESGTYYVTVFTPDGCSASDTIEVFIPPYTNMNTIMIDSIYVCQGQVVPMYVTVENGIAPYFYEWEDLPDSSFSVYLTADTTRYYKVIITDHCGEQVADSVKLIVFPQPDINLGNDTLICIDGSYTIHAGGGYASYIWQDGSSDSTLTITEPGTYWVEVISAFGCISYDTINIEVFPAVQMDLGNDTILCDGQTLILDPGSEFILYEWQNGSSNQTFTVVEPGTYWVSVIDQNNCSAIDSIHVDFQSLPEINLGTDFSLCDNEEQTITPGPGFVSYLWQDGSTNPSFVVTQEGTYWVTVNNGCGEDTDSIYVTIDPSPQPDLGSDTTICTGQNIILEPSGSFLTYLWQDNTTQPFFMVNTSGLYSVEVTNVYNCHGTDEIYVSVADPQVDLGTVNHVCEGDSLILDAGSGFDSYLWQDNSTGQFFTVSDAGTFAVSVVDPNGCATQASIDIDLYPNPVLDISGNMEFCEGGSIILEAPEGNYNYYWDGEAGNQSITVNQSGYYTLCIANPCDSISKTIEVTEVPLPQVFLGEDQVFLPGETIELDAGAGFDQYQWQDGSGQQYFEVTENNADPENPYYYVEVTQGICKNSDTVKIEMFLVWVPKVITPNGDNKNDYFAPDPAQWQGVQKHHMTVYNRWGEKVWESEDFPSGWDAKRNGNYVSDGTYFWVLEVYYGDDLIKQTLKGSLTILGVDP
ncbi:MAG: gliding motility-associated C-terminal domain-containing protein [Bacteroidales bacterium]|nr:gliding motility-associated C-terminal domain-containing protein [Bacteroidales bacterium]